MKYITHYKGLNINEFFSRYECKMFGFYDAMCEMAHFLNMIFCSPTSKRYIVIIKTSGLWVFNIKIIKISEREMAKRTSVQCPRMNLNKKS